MSKIDDMRALREARQAERTKPGAAPSYRQPAIRFGAPGETAAARATAARPATKATREKAPVAPPEPAAAATQELCGHRNMSGRTCTREQGHSAKSHRYS